MTTLRVLLERLRGLFGGRRAERDLDDELNFHLEMQAGENRRRGMSESEARDAALRQFGGVARTRETWRETRSLPWFDVARQDFRYGLRMLLRNPGFTAVAVLSLALGIGANTAIFTLINALILRPLPVAHPQDLVYLQQISVHGDMNDWTAEAFEFYHGRSDLFSAVFAQSESHLNVEFGSQPTPVDGLFVSGGYFPTLGVPPVLGRTLKPADDRESGGPDGPVGVISYRLWMSRFGGEPTVLGRSIVVESSPIRIVGVMPASFFGVEVGKSPNLFVPLRLEPMLMKQNALLHQPFAWWLAVLARRAPGLPDAAFHAGVAALGPRLSDVLPKSRARASNKPAPPLRIAAAYAGNGFSGLRRKFSQPLYILMGIAGLVLLIACANVANLLLARTGARQREIAVRLALGASRARLFRQLLTESLLLSGLGAALGIAFAFWGCRFLLTLLSRVELNVHPDPRVLAFTALVALATGVLFGSGPALRAASGGTAASLKERSQSVSGRSRAAGLLVVVQVSLCLVLLVGAGLFIRTFWNLTNQHLGFDRQHLYVAGIDPRPAGFKDEKLVRMYTELLGKLNSHPGIQSASLSMLTPIGLCCWSQPFAVEGYTPAPDERRTVLLNAVSPGYFRTFGTRLIAGRDFSERDNQGAPLAAIVSQSFVRQYFAGSNPLGRHLTLVNDTLWKNVEIVGVVEETRTRNLRATQEMEAYFPLFQLVGLGRAMVEIRTAQSTVAAAPLLREQVQSFARQIPVNVESFSEQVDRTASSDRMTALLAGFFGSLALALVCIGLYGTMSYAVIRRTGELGIRMALGARAADVTGMILRQAVLLASAGALIGIPAALLGARAITSLSSLLFGLESDDPATIAVVTVLLIVLAACSGYLPARRAARLDPVTALRNE
jgi:predicted permease